MFEIIQNFFTDHIFKLQFVKYIISGFLAFIAHIVILSIFVEIFKITPIISTSCGFIAAILVNYYIQYHWIFHSVKTYKQTFILYTLLSLLCFFINGIIFNLILHNTNLHYLINQIFCTTIIFIINYKLNKHFVFR